MNDDTINYLQLHLQTSSWSTGNTNFVNQTLSQK